MTQQIIKEITNLKRNYKHNSNIYEIKYLEITEKIFMEKLKNIINNKWDDIKIIENKEYIDNRLILNINSCGEMYCFNIKVLKYKYIDNVKINLLNKKQINCDNYNGTTNYDKVYKQKKMIFSKDGFELLMIIKTDNDKISTYEINITFNTKIDEKNLINIIEKL